MVKGNDVIGLKIINLTTGDELGTIKDLLYDPGSQEVKALLVENKGLFSDAKVLPISEAQSIGSDAVMIRSDDAIRAAGTTPPVVNDILKANAYLTKTNIITEDGHVGQREL